MPARNVLKNFNLFVDGLGYAGQVEDFTPPKLTIKTDDFMAGGMDAPLELDMGQEKLEASFSIVSYDRAVLSKWGITQSAFIPFIVRGAVESTDGTVTSVAHVMRGFVKELDEGTWKPGEKTPIKVSLSLSYYQMDHGGIPVHMIDVQNMVRIVNGVDRLAKIRSAIGM